MKKSRFGIYYKTYIILCMLHLQKSRHYEAETSVTKHTSSLADIWMAIFWLCYGELHVSSRPDITEIKEERVIKSPCAVGHQPLHFRVLVFCDIGRLDRGCVFFYAVTNVRYLQHCFRLWCYHTAWFLFHKHYTDTYTHTQNQQIRCN